MEELLNINGRKIFVKLLGKGEPLIFLHSSLLSSEMWNNQIEYFSKKYSTITFDFCGYGKSDLPNGSYSDYEDLKTILTNYQDDKAVLIGCSYGGSVALDFSLKYPSFVKKLVLITPAINKYKYPFKLTLESIKNFMNVKKYGIEKALELFILNKFWNYFAPKEHHSLEIFRQLYLSNKYFYNGKYNQRQILRPVAIKILSEINIETLLIGTENDSKFNKDVVNIIKNNVKGIKYHEIKNCGHLPNIENEGELNKIITEYLS